MPLEIWNYVCVRERECEQCHYPSIIPISYLCPTLLQNISDLSWTHIHTQVFFFPSPVVFLGSWCLSQSTHWHLYPLIPLAHTGLPRNVFYMMTAAKIWHLFNHSKKNIHIKKSHLMKIKRNQILSKYLCSYHINCNVCVFYYYYFMTLHYSWNNKFANPLLKV